MSPGGVYNDEANIVLRPTGGSTVYYTLDGSQPTEKSPSTDQDLTLTVDKTTTVRAFSMMRGKINSDTVSATYEVDISPYRPVLSLEGGTYHGTIFVHATCVAGEGIDIHYTLDGSEPTAQSALFTPDKPAVLVTDATLKARSFQGDLPLNRTVTQDYKILPVQEKAGMADLPDEGVYEGSVEIPFEGLAQDTLVFYTTDGSDPSPESEIVHKGEKLTFNQSVTLKMMAVRKTKNPGKVVCLDYKIRNPKPVVKTLSDKSTKDKLAIQISTPVPDSVVYYTTDGSEPNEKSNVVKTKKTIQISKATTVKALTKAGGREDSQLFSQKYNPAAAAGKPKKTDKKVIALTFDDGPGKYTDELLTGLKKRGAKATFFMMGMNAERFPDAVKRMSKEGHELGNHTWSHTDITMLSDADYKKALKKTNDLIEKLTGKRPKLFRPPGGSYDSRKSPENMTRVLWNMDTRDWRYRNADYVCDYIVEHAKTGDVILLHDLYESTVKGALRAIDKLKKEGYAFVTYSEMQKYK